MPSSDRSKAGLPGVEGLLIDVLRMVSTGRSDEVSERVRRTLANSTSRKKLGISEPARAAILALLAEAPLQPTDRAPRAGVRRVGTTSRDLIPATAAPVLDNASRAALDQVVLEYEQRDRLAESGLGPTRTILLSGPPGVGKSMTMQWLADRLGLPLMRVEPGKVIGSLLGESSRSLSQAFAAAKESGALLGLDEVDALAKRRDDVHDVGEFKRFVSTLLLELDRWPDTAPVVAATNHLQLLDPALERRFELHLSLDVPGLDGRTQILSHALSDLQLEPAKSVTEVIAATTAGQTGAAISGLVRRAARRTALTDTPLETALLVEGAPSEHTGSKEARELFAAAARDIGGLSSRSIGDLLGCSHTAAQRLANAGSKQAER